MRRRRRRNRCCRDDGIGGTCDKHKRASDRRVAALVVDCCTTNPQQTVDLLWICCTTNPQQIAVMEFALNYAVSCGCDSRRRLAACLAFLVNVILALLRCRRHHAGSAADVITVSATGRLLMAAAVARLKSPRLRR